MKQIADTKSRYLIEALARGLEVLSLFSRERTTLSLTEITEALAISKSTAFRILATLEQSDYVEYDTVSRRYRPGLKVLQLGFTALDTLDIRQIARPQLERLAQELDETASLAMRDGSNIVYIDRVRNRAIVGVVLGVGSHVPAHAVSLGKVLLADLSDAELDSCLTGAELSALTDYTLTSRAALQHELAIVRRQGYAISNQELALGLRGIAAPIRDSTGKAVAALNVSGPAATMTHERIQQEIAPAVIAAAERISAALGFTKTTGF